MRKIKNYINRLKLNLKRKLGEAVLSAISINDISVDVHERSGSWAVISLKGDKKRYLKFVDLDDASLMEITKFLRQFEKMNPDEINIDANPYTSKLIKDDLYLMQM